MKISMSPLPQFVSVITMSDKSHQITRDFDKMVTLEMHFRNEKFYMINFIKTMSLNLLRVVTWVRNFTLQVMSYDHIHWYFFIYRILLCVAFLVQTSTPIKVFTSIKKS